MMALVRWAVLLPALSVAALYAQLVAPPTIDWVNLPATATLNQTVNVGVGAHANLSDNSDGNNWNTTAVVAAINVYLQRPGQSETQIHGFISPWRTPADAWTSFVPTQTGTHYVRVQIMDGRPWYSNSLTYAVAVNPPPGPVISSSLSVGANQGQTISYQITATNSPTNFSASNLPAGLSLNASTGAISGTITGSGTISSSITAANAYGSDTKTLTWSITAASLAGVPGVTPTPQAEAAPVVFSSTVSANFGVAWVEHTIWRPNGSPYVPGNTTGTSSSFNWVPDGGRGTYTYVIRVVDVYYNYQDFITTFQVRGVPSASLSASTTTPAFGQSVTLSSTATDPDNDLALHSIWWDQGNGSYWSNAQFAWNYPASGGYTISNVNGATSPSGQTITATFTAAEAKPFVFLGAAHDSIGWFGNMTQLTINVARATPAAAFASRSFSPNSSGAYIVQVADLNAVFSNPYNSGVAAPSGTVTYSLVGAGANVQSGTSLNTGSHTIRASYSGDSNYNARTVDATFTVVGPTTPGGFQVTTPASSFVTLSWGPSTAPSGINRYEIFRGGVLLQSVSGTVLSFTDNTAAPATAYTYTVRAVDNNNNVSPVATLSLTTARPLVVFTP